MMDIEIRVALSILLALVNLANIGLLIWRCIKLERENREIRYHKEFWDLYGTTAYDGRGFIKRYAESNKVVTLDDRRRYDPIPSNSGGGRAA